MLGLGVAINNSANESALIAGRIPGFTGLLDESYGSGAAAAYSVRQLSSSETVAMTIRRDSDNSELDIGFDSEGNLDESAISTFCSGTTCKVSSWRDQSGNRNDATQATAANQPTIYTGGAIVKENGRVAVQGTSGSTELVAAISHTVTAQSTFGTGTYVYGTNDRFISQNNGGNDYSGSDSYIIGYASATNTISSLLDAAARGSITVSNNQYMLFSSVHSGSSLLNAVNGTTGTAYTHTLNSTFSRLGIMGTGGSVAEGWQGKMQEVVMYDADKSTDRTSIESNIGDYFTQNTPLLDTYTGAAAAYSLRKLSSSYSGSAIRVRRASDNAETDINFNVFGELDTVSLAAHCGSSNGYCVRWYDQSGNLNDATQTTTANQPKIYDGTTGVVTKNAKPAITGVSSSSRLSIASLMSLNDFCISMVYEEYRSNKMTWGHDTTYYNYHTSGGGRVNNMINWTSNINVGDQGLYFLNRASSAAELHMNSSSLATSTYGNIYYFQDLFNGHTNTFGYIAPIQEFILWQSDQSSNRTNIESNINTFYSIY